MPRFLHVANGSSTTGLIEAAGLPGATSIWADPLYEGPVPGNIADEELTRVRQRYLDPDGSESGTRNDLREWRRAIYDVDGYDELVLWYEHDLFDQLNLIQVLTWIRERVPGVRIVSLVCVGEFPGRPAFKGLGELKPSEIASLLERRERVSEGHYQMAANAWSAFRSETPELLDELRRRPTGPLPYLAPALKRFLQEYPWMEDGLSRTERRLLHLAGSAPINLLDAFPRMQDGESAYYVTDRSLAVMARAFAASSPPLMSLAPRQERAPALNVRAALTETGREILHSRRDRVLTCGIDRWLGGVHLQTGSPVWRWDERHDRMAVS